MNGIGMNYGAYNAYSAYSANASAYKGYVSPAMQERADSIKEAMGINPKSKEEAHKAQGGKCETCENRTYQDGSDEMVSFKTPTKISPEQAYGKVLSHEKEHVANAVAEGSKPNKELVSATVTLKTDICPECGRSYIAGGTTTTVMKTYNSDPYSQNRKSYEAESLKGNGVDLKL